MKMYARIFALYRTALFRTIRLLIFSFLLCLLSYQLSQQNLSSLIVFFFNVFVMIEIFFHYKVSRVTPGMTIAKNDGKDVLVSFTLPALELFLTRLKTSMVIKSVLSYPQIKALLQKADITQKDIVLIDVDKKELAKNAFEMAKMAQGIFVTTVDILLAYLLLTEEQTKMLFTKKLKTTDMQNIAVWIRNEFQTEEYPKPFRVRFDGAGIGEALVSGWTPETKKYTDNFTSYALSEEPLLIGRQAEFRDILEGVVKLDSNSVLLVGDIGAGKENMVRALAYQSFEGRLGRGLNYKRIFQLLVGPLTAGVGNRSDLEVRLQNIIAEISHANDVILYIPDFQNIVGASSYNLDLSGALLPYLKSGTMPVVATMTTGTYKTYMEHNPL
ncbi:MAG TPA: hypothetical protein VE090_01115, partial [Methylomirabilota bacterium]|nr:hypothetical protein [Methylomirabilota bacterium]